MKSTIQEHWETFNLQVISKDAPDVQRQEMRRAFYAGAEAFNLAQWDAGNEDVSGEAGVAMIEGLNDEIKLFASDVAKGLA